MVLLGRTPSPPNHLLPSDCPRHIARFQFPTLLEPLHSRWATRRAQSWAHLRCEHTRHSCRIPRHWLFLPAFAWLLVDVAHGSAGKCTAWLRPRILA